MSDKTSGAAKAPAAHGVWVSAKPLSLGLGLLLGGGLLSVSGAAALPLAAIIGIAAIVLGAFIFVVGVYQFADNVDRAARALIENR